tara:strand:+ start:1083 stop:1964 length:882 start_codon:yes stop_codon:yes gene_type:complete
MTEEEKKTIEGISTISSALSEKARQELVENLVEQLSEKARQELVENLAGGKNAYETPIPTPRETFPSTPDPLEHRQYIPQPDKQQEYKKQPEETSAGSANLPKPPQLNPEEPGGQNPFAAGFKPKILESEDQNIDPSAGYASAPIRMQQSSGPNKNTAEQNAVNQLIQSQNYDDFIKIFTNIITNKVVNGTSIDKARKTSRILNLFVNTIRDSINEDPNQKDSNLVNVIKNINPNDLIEIITNKGINLNINDKSHVEGFKNLNKLINEDLETQNPRPIAQKPEHKDVVGEREL